MCAHCADLPGPHLLNILVNALIQQPCHPELVNVQAGGVHIVEDHGVAQLVVRLPVEGIAACMAEVQDSVACVHAESQAQGCRVAA